MCRDTGHDNCNFPQKKAEGGGDGDSENEKRIQFLTQLDRKIRETPQYSMLRMWYLMIITIKTY